MAIVLPHGVLFRGSSEGDIRRKLLEKNNIDAVIGLPANLFTNTGIPVVIIVLKKNRKIDDPVLIIDASKSFIKAGKQNVLQEKDIAKIVDVFVNKTELAGYSLLASREEIAKNEYNMNIPRYVESIDSEIPHDVDAHLLGGIPKSNIDDLAVLNSLVPHILDKNLETIRPGYVKLKTSVTDLTNEILKDEKITEISKEIKDKTEKYIAKYWNILRNKDSSTDIAAIMDEMLEEIKKSLTHYKFIVVYNGYQVIAEIWKNALNHDAEIIANEGFYRAGRSREPHMVTKGSGSNKREEMDGFFGRIIPNDLIAHKLYSDEIKAIENKRQAVQDVEGELSDLIEAAKVEDSEENAALYDALKKNENDEAGDSFDSKALKNEIKKAAHDSEEYKLLKKVESLLSKKSRINKEIKKDETDLKNEVQERIIKLTDDEIDMLVFKKWFGNIVAEMVDLIKIPLKAEIDVIEMLQERYGDTLADIDAEIASLMSDFNELRSELVVE